MNRIDHETEEAVRRFLALIAGRFDIARRHCLRQSRAWDTSPR